MRRDGGRIGYDPWLHTSDWVQARERGAGRARAPSWSRSRRNPIDAVWADRPEPSKARLVVHPDEYAGKISAAKRQEMADWLHEQKADAAVLSALDSIAWTFNVRGKDVDAYAGRPLLRAGPRRRHRRPVRRLGEDRRRRPPASRQRRPAPRARTPSSRISRALAGKTVAPIPSARWRRSSRRWRRPAPRSSQKRDPSVLPKAIKNEAEIAGHRAAQARDGAALGRFLHWLSIEAPKGERRRAERGRRGSQAVPPARAATFATFSFDTISGAGPNGAIVHYRVSEETNRPLEMDSLYLVDSGGQYPDGTTDVTRTVAIGEPTAEMRDRFTRVLKGHIAIARAVFPKGTRGSQLDSFARQSSVGGRARLCPRHRPRRRQLSRRARGAAADLAGREQPGRRRRAAPAPA